MTKNEETFAEKYDVATIAAVAAVTTAVYITVAIATNKTVKHIQKKYNRLRVK